MTMLSFRVSDDEAAALREWSERLGTDRSQLLRDAWNRYVADLHAETDVAAWTSQPLSSDEKAIFETSEWGPAEDWSDWDNA